MFLYFKRDQMPVVHLVLSTPVRITNENRLKRKKKKIMPKLVISLEQL